MFLRASAIGLFGPTIRLLRLVNAYMKVRGNIGEKKKIVDYIVASLAWAARRQGCSSLL
jgi:hypothetical protein